MAVTSALFDTSVGLLVNKLREEAEKLRESDVRREIDYIKLQLDGLARSHLLSSITLCREGVLHLFKLKSRTGEDQVKIAQSGEGIEDRQVAVFASRSPIDRIPNLSRDLKDLKLTNLDDEEERALSAAKKDFEQARIKAIEAFKNESLPPCDRIQAMVIRVAATMLENVDHPEDALPVCISCLEELHALPEVKESFSVEINKPALKYHVSKEHRRQIISSVCRINHAVRNAAVMVAKKGELFALPLIDSGVEQIDPLHDLRVGESLGKLGMQHYSVAALTLGQKNEKEKPKIPQGIASNSIGHFIVGDEWDRSVKIFESDGNFHSTFCGIPTDDENTIVSIADVATDIFDNVYVLVDLQEKSSSTARYKIYLFDQQGNTKHHFFLRKETAEVLRVTVSRHNEILVLGDSSEDNTKSIVDIYNPDGQFNRSFGEKTLNRAEDVCATSDGRVVVLDRDDQGALSVLVFGPDGECINDDFLKHFEKKERPITKLRSSIASHRESNHVVIAIPSEERNPVQILRLDIDSGTFLPNILLPVGGLVSTRGISVTVEGRIALSLLDKTGGDSKVLVV